MPNTLAVLAETGIRVDPLESILHFALKPRGRALPVGEHFVVDPGFSATGAPSRQVMFWLQTVDGDNAPLGRFVATADESAAFLVDGKPATLHELLDSIDADHPFARVRADREGQVARFELLSSAARHG